MISRFLAKVVISIVLLGLVAVELGSPLVVRLQLDGVAHDAADESAFTLSRSRSSVEAQGTAEQIVRGRGATLRSFEIDAAGAANLTVAREAPSLILKRVDKLKSRYDVSVRAVAPKRSA